MVGDYELKDNIIHLRFESKSSSRSKTRIPSSSTSCRLCKLRNTCKVIALVHLGYYHLSCITHNLVFKSKNCISFEELSLSIKP